MNLNASECKDNSKPLLVYLKNTFFQKIPKIILLNMLKIPKFILSNMLKIPKFVHGML